MIQTKIGTRVQFRDDFSPALRGIVFEVDTRPSLDVIAGREMIGVRSRVGERWVHRLAYVTDLVPARESAPR